MITTRAAAAILAASTVAFVSAQRPQFNDSVRAFIKVDAPVVALTNARVIDGTGAPARATQTIVIRGTDIAEIGDSARVKPPEGATVIDLSGKSKNCAWDFTTASCK